MTETEDRHPDNRNEEVETDVNHNVNEVYEHPPVERVVNESPALEEPSPVIGAEPENFDPSPEADPGKNQEFPREIRRDRADDIEAAAEAPAIPRDRDFEQPDINNKNEDVGPMGQAAEQIEDVTEPVTEGRGNAVGLAAVALSVLALFIFPVLMSIAGIITGYIAYRREARTLGLWAMGIGVVALLASLVFAPFFG
ncbi:MAG: hypothetical protein H0Z33_00740 [Bacillaceae bacterium]|nr:hypothetical protein [Bacillaceae bacterium]